MLLGDRLGVLIVGVRRLNRWEALTDQFSLVARRLRSTWLVRWFGSGVPVDGVDLRINITNLDALQQRWSRVGRRTVAEPLGPNLTEPLLGDAGAVFGILANPVGALIAVAALNNHVSSIGAKLGLMFSWLLAGLPVSAALLLAAPLLALALLPAGLGGQARGVYDLFGAIAELGRPLQMLWDQLSGRAPVRNPLLAQLVRFADRLAALAAQLLGAVAVAVTRFARMIGPLRAAALASMQAVGEIVAAIQLVATDTQAALLLMFDGPHSVSAILAASQASVGRVLDRVMAMVMRGFTTVTGYLVARANSTVPTVVHWVVEAVHYVARVLAGNPVILWLLGFREQLATMQGWSARLPAAPPAAKPAASPAASSGGGFPLPPMPHSVRMLQSALAHPPPAPPVPTFALPPILSPGVASTLAPALRLLGAPGSPDPFRLSVEQRAALERQRRPPSVFGLMRQDLRRREAKSDSEDRLWTLSAALATVAPAISRSAATAASEYAGQYLPRLVGVLDAIDAELRRAPRRLPTRELPEPATVRPVIDRLVIRRPGPASSRAELERFARSLRRELDAADYPVPAAASR
jgi:hypothetical protein